MIDGSGAQFLTDFGFVSMMRMQEKIERHGFYVTRVRQDDGVPVMCVTGMWYGGEIRVVVPENPLENHASPLQDVYLVIGLTLSEICGWSGNC